MRTARGCTHAILEGGNENAGLHFMWGHVNGGSMASEDHTALWLHWNTGSTESCWLTRYDARGHGNSSDADDPHLFTWSELAKVL